MVDLGLVRSPNASLLHQRLIAITSTPIQIYRKETEFWSKNKVLQWNKLLLLVVVLKNHASVDSVDLASFRRQLKCAPPLN